MVRQPCLPIDDSTGYLKEKQLDSLLLFKSVGLQSARDSWYGPCLQYPLTNVHGEITGYERIFPRGLLHKRSPDRFSKQDNKKVTRGTRVSHSFALLGITLSQLPNYFGTVRIVGGLADATNVYLATKEPVVAIVGEHNARAVVEQLVNQWPHLNRHIIVALDHDLPGIAASHRSGCVWKVPDQFGEDWSDLAQRAGLDAVRRQLQTVRKPIQPVTLSTIPKPAVDMTIDACCNDYRKSLKALSLCKNELTAATLAKVIILRFYRRVPASLSEQAFLQAIVIANPYFLHPETVQQLKRLLHSYCARQQQVMDREAGLSQMMKTTLGDQYQPINTLRKETVPVEKGQITLIKAPYAAGKTKLLAALSHTALQKDEKVLAITHLVSLAHELSRRLQLNSYLDMPTAFMTGINRLVTCINSLCSPVLSQFLAIGKPDVLILDEFSQHISVLATSPHIKDPSILSRYLDLIEQTSTVVICDADLSSYHIRLLQEWFPDRKVQCYDMPFPEHSDRSCHFSTGKQCAHAVVEQKLLPALARGERVAIATDSRCHACKLDEIVQKRLPHIPRLLIHGKNRTEQEQAAFLQDNHKVVHRYQLIIYTPAIQSGLSIDAPVDQVFGFSHNVILPTDFVQMLRRCRTANTFNLVADLMPGKRGNEDWLARLQALQHAQRYNSNCDGVAIQEYDGFCERERSRHIRLRSLAANGLFYLMQSRGFTMHYDQSLTHSQAFKTFWQEAEETVERKELKAVFTAPALSQPQFEQLNQKVDPSQQEQYSCERYRISEELGITANELQERDICFWKNTGLTRLRRFMQFPLENGHNYRPQSDVRATPLCQRRFEQIGVDVYRDLLTPLFPDWDYSQSWSEVEADKVLDRVEHWQNQYPFMLNQLRLIPDSVIRNTQEGACYQRPKSACQFVNQLLRMAGLKIESRQSRVGKGDLKAGENPRVRHYSIQPESLITMRRYAWSRAEHKKISVSQPEDLSISEARSVTVNQSVIKPSTNAGEQSLQSSKAGHDLITSNNSVHSAARLSRDCFPTNKNTSYPTGLR